MNLKIVEKYNRLENHRFLSATESEIKAHKVKIESLKAEINISC